MRIMIMHYAVCRRSSVFIRLIARKLQFFSSIPKGFTSTSPHVSYPPCPVLVDSPNKIDASSLIIERTEKPKAVIPKEHLIFGRNFSDHMLDINWDSKNGWHNPVIKPYENLSISPAASSFHYALECFEGMKAYKDKDGNIRLFRPSLNMTRFNYSLSRMYMPTVDGPTFLGLLRELLLVDKHWIPEGDGFSLYIRPTAISTHKYLGVGPAEEIKIFVITSPAGPYFSTGFKPVSLWADTKHTRAWLGGTGDAKVGSNYAGTLMPQMSATKYGCSQVLWLYNERNSEFLLAEAGSMNLFVVIRDPITRRTQLVTAPLTRGDILPGVTRASILELTAEWNNLDVLETDLSLKDLIELNRIGCLLEVFGAGTAAVISPVKTIKFMENNEVKSINVPTGDKIGPIAQELYSKISDIQYGKIDHDWSVVL